ncbi:MAG: sigma-70 family RNA polymerase sigma factor [Nitrososphaerota archaeon]
MSEAAASPAFTRLFSDERLTRRAVGGDERAFGAIFRRYHQSLYRFCLAIVGNPDDAQEALQNTMAKVLRALPGEERTIELKPWLYRIAHNESIDLLRRRRESRELDVEQVAPGYGLAEDAATRERLRGLIVDLKELPERQREALVMRELGGLEFEEIATALGTSGAVARQTLYEARQSLRQMEAGREMSCAAVTKALSDGDGRVIRRRDVRAHLRSCAACRDFRDEIKSRERDLMALGPLPAVAAAGMLHGLLGGSQGASGGGLAASLGGGAAKTIAASAAAKGLATAAVVAAIGVTAADRTGVIHLGLPGEPSSQPAQRAPATPGEAAGTAPGHAAGRSGAAAHSGTADGARGAKSHGDREGGRKAGVRSGGAPAHAHRHVPTPHAGSQGYGPGAEHPSGKGHETQHPPAAAKGQETAAPHQPTSPGPATGAGHAAPAPQPPTAAAPPEEAPANPPTAAPAAPAPNPPPAAEGASSGQAGANANRPENIR